MILIGIRLFQKPKPNMIRHINSKDASFGKITVSSINNDKIRRSHNRPQAISHLDFAIISGKRDMAEQRRLVRSGASQTLHSRHLTGHAIDVVPLDPKTGKGRFSRALALEVAAAFYAAGQDCDVPITWGGMWSQFEDTPHFEIPIRGH